MSEKLTYKNRKGTFYYFREVSGKRGTQIVCSQTESDNDLSAIPETHEIVESPNGQVFCRKKMKSNITREEASCAENMVPSMMAPAIRILVETKKNVLIIHSADTSDFNELAKLALGWCADSAGVKAITEGNLRYEPTLKLELADKKERRFALYRMCWVGGDPDWHYLDEGHLPALLEKYAPHIGQESFYELF